jgi:flagellin
MTTQRWLGVADAGMKRSLERLSSGYRINRAADDAAGLAISQSFRADIASFKVASRNTSEAGSLLQVAEGAMDQIGNMLTRLKELATQAASGNAGDDITKINSEANQLVSEIDRIANSTEYADTALLTGNLGSGSMEGALGDGAHGSDQTVLGESGGWFGATGTGDTATITAITGTLDSGIAALTDTQNAWTIAKDGTASGFDISNGTMSFDGTLNTGAATITIAGMGEDGGDLVIAAAGINLTAGLDADTITFDNLGLSSVTVDSSATTGVYTFSTSADAEGLLLQGPGGINEAETKTDGSGSVDFATLGISFTLGAEYDDDDLEGLVITVSGTSGTSMDFQVGAENDTNNRLSVNIDSTTATDLSLANDMMSSQATAQTALTTIDTAISTLSTNRGNVGGYMNRLSYASANLLSTIENVQAAESVIRDVDMASEMTDFTKNQILLQAGTAMLAQANMAPQQVLALFG